MRRDQLEHAIRTACQIIEELAVVVVGSQAILGTFAEDQLPPEATMSIEIDILPIADDNDETTRLADLIEGVAGEWSPFEEQHGFSIDGVDQIQVPCACHDPCRQRSRAGTNSRRRAGRDQAKPSYDPMVVGLPK